MKPFGEEFDKDVLIESRTGSRRYRVNLHKFTCTCPDFEQRRKDIPIGDLGRTCKHLRDLVLQLDTDSFGDDLTRVIFKSPHGPYNRIWFAPAPDGEIVALGMRADKDWLNLFVRQSSDGPYDRYGYNPAEERWSYDSTPPFADELIKMLKLIPGGLEG